MGKRGKKYIPNERDGKLVTNLAFAGYTQVEVAGVFEISKNTLQKYYRKEWVRGSIEMVGTVAAATYINATKKMNATAQCAIMNNVGPWQRGGREVATEARKIVIEITSKGRPIVMPDDFNE